VRYTCRRINCLDRCRDKWSYLPAIFWRCIQLYHIIFVHLNRIVVHLGVNSDGGVATSICWETLSRNPRLLLYRVDHSITLDGFISIKLAHHSPHHHSHTRTIHRSRHCPHCYLASVDDCRIEDAKVVTHPSHHYVRSSRWERQLRTSEDVMVAPVKMNAAISLIADLEVGSEVVLTLDISRWW
jgi:hypothetical protein